MKIKDKNFIDHFDNATQIISGFGADPICDEIGTLATDHENMDNHGEETRPVLPCANGLHLMLYWLGA